MVKTLKRKVNAPVVGALAAAESSRLGDVAEDSAAVFAAQRPSAGGTVQVMRELGVETV